MSSIYGNNLTLQRGPAACIWGPRSQGKHTSPLTELWSFNITFPHLHQQSRAVIFFGLLTLLGEDYVRTA